MDWKIILLIVGLLLLVLGIFFYLRRRKEYGSYIHKLPLSDLGYPNIPAFPFKLDEIPETLIRLGLRANATTQAKWA